MKRAVNVSKSALAELFVRVRKGDAGSRRRLFDFLSRSGHFAAGLRRIARATLARRSGTRRLVDTDDLVQSALALGMATCSRFRGDTEGQFLRWLGAIVRGRLDRIARNRRKSVVACSDELECIPGEMLDPAVMLVEQELQACLWREVSRLPWGERLVIGLRMSGVTAEEISKLLGLKPATVRKRESRAAKQLREKLS